MAMLRGVLLGGLMLISFFGYAQKYAQSSGNWIAITWSSDQAGLIPSPGTPTALDDVYTNGRNITITTAVSCRNLAVSYNVAGSLVFNVGSSLTVTSAMFTWDDGAQFFSGPSVNVFLGSGAIVAITFTGANYNSFGGLFFDNQVLAYWNSNSPIGRATFNLPNTSTFSIDNDGVNSIAINQFFINNNSDLKTSFFNFPISPASAGLEISTNFSLSNPTTVFDCSVPIRGTSTLSSRINSTSISGTLLTNSYFNATTFNMGASGVLRTSFSGSDQTEGWWYQSASPTGGTINASATINFDADAAQNIPARSYGNLILDAASSVTKSLSSGTLNVTGTLTILNSGVSLNTASASGINIGGNLVSNANWTSSVPVAFNGVAAQSISGSGSMAFNSGLTLGKASGTLTLNQNISIQNGLTISSGTLDLGSNNVNLSGNLSVSGSLVASNSTLTITGATSITSGSPSLNNLTISGTGSFTAPSSFSLTGNLSNSGSFNSNNGTITFNGTTAQSISGTSTLTNINCNTTSGGSVSINGNVTLNGVLTLSSSGIFDADGSGGGVFTVASLDQNAGGRIAALPNPGNFSGEVTVQRFIHSQAGGDYRYLSMPITTNQNNLSRWKAAIGVTGAFSDRSVNSEFANIQDSGNTNPSVFTWNGTAYVGVTGADTGATTLSSRTGYVAYNYNNGSVTASYRGDIETGSVPISISNVNGNFNLVPNPYPSPIDFDNVSKSNINNSLWLRTGNNTFSSYVGGVATLPPFVGWGGEIAIGQSFWTQSNGGGSTLTLNETDKTNNSVRFLRTETPTNYVRLTLTGADQLDEAVIRFADGGSDDLNGKFDAVKRKNGNYVSAFGQNNYLNLSVYTVSAAIDYAIKGIAPLSATEATRIVPLKVADAKNGNYTLKFTELSTFDLGYKIFLKDKFLSKEVEIEDNEEYEFSITSNASTTGSARFELVFRKDIVTALEPTLTQEVLVYPNPVSSDGRLTIVIPEQLDAPILSIFLYDMKGSVIYSSENDKKILEPGVKTIEMGQAGTGLYILNITSGNEIKSIRVLKR